MVVQWLSQEGSGLEPHWGTGAFCVCLLSSLLHLPLTVQRLQIDLRWERWSVLTCQVCYELVTCPGCVKGSWDYAGEWNYPHYYGKDNRFVTSVL